MEWTCQTSVSARRSGSEKINSILLERIVTVFSLLILSVLLLPAFPGDLAARTFWLFAILAAAGFSGILLLTCLDRLPAAILRLRMLRGLTEHSQDSRMLFLRPGNALPTLLVAIVSHVNMALVVWALALALGVRVSLLDCIAIVPPAILIATIPISIAGWGVRETAFIAGFGAAGVPAADALAVSILYGMMGLAFAAPGAVLWLIGRTDRDAARDDDHAPT